ncbi:hypothetical protein BJY52DRAFT_666296 [Lactarius psammicola]|nr:hypothetical protein BJY52DRAFT_666296 [Lactarius psammicola]
MTAAETLPTWVFSIVASLLDRLGVIEGWLTCRPIVVSGWLPERRLDDKGFEPCWKDEETSFETWPHTLSNSDSVGGNLGTHYCNSSPWLDTADRRWRSSTAVNTYLSSVGRVGLLGSLTPRKRFSTPGLQLKSRIRYGGNLASVDPPSCTSPFSALCGYLIVTNGRSIGKTRPHVGDGYEKRQDVRQWGEWTVRMCAVANYSNAFT